ncbi:nucleotide sugar dehydrogenase [Candidatus Magnetomonas plexicatena]|uniref:nucleotide sugar dehydrogenase n=1 Tax=Candidatus Magnetomonas plexicatena TaxID=2552947 RepID=UPI001C797A56|nr:nucleotide sugar dehydrogenase [Nitrospirales bacterium LBB_01]
MDKSYDICIVGGLGHIGLPMGITMAKAGKSVLLIDINPEAIKTVSCGKVPFMEAGAEETLKEVLNKTLFISNNNSDIRLCKFVVIVIGTPVDEHLNPQFTIFKKLFLTLMDNITDTHHIILRSTVYPGTTERIRDFLHSHGKRIALTFCPERIAEGKALEELSSLPQIIGAFDDKSFNEASAFFNALTTDIIRLTPLEAELTKLFTNVWRYILFSISNQFYQVATQNNVDFYKVYNAAVHHYPRMAGFAKAGFAAGPCLFKDTMQLAAFSNNEFFLGHAAMLINEGLPNFIVKRLKDKYNLKEKRVGIIGMAFKGDIDDERESLSYKLKKILEFEAKEVLCTDPYVRDDRLVPLSECIEASDILILGAPHSCYKGLTIDKTSKVLVDIWNFYGEGGYF